MLPSVDDFDSFVTPNWLSEVDCVVHEIQSGTPTLSILKRLRKIFSQQQCQFAIELAQLRMRGIKKFTRAAQMFFTRKALEMATDERLAEYKAARFAANAYVADICCSIGGDLIGLSKNCQVVGFDSDPLMVEFANRNLSIYEKQPTAQQTVFEAVDLAEFDAIHIDPERRSPSGRTIVGQEFSPPMKLVIARLQEFDRSAAIKVAPATQNVDDFNGEIERHWVGHSRECKQQIIWTGSLAHHPSCRTASRIDFDHLESFSCPESEVHIKDLEFAIELGAYVHEPHSVLLASKLENAFASRNDVKRFGAEVCYFTGDVELSSHLISSFKVIDVVPAKVKKVKELLKSHRVGNLEIKKRGLAESFVRPFFNIETTGEIDRTLILTVLNNRRLAILAERTCS